MTKSAYDAETAQIPLRWLKNLPTPLFLLDNRGKIVFCNDALVELTGYLREELIGAGLDTLSDRDGIQAALKDTLAVYEGKGLVRREYDLQRKSGTRIHVVADITPLYGEEEKAELVTNALGVVLEMMPLG